MINVDANRLNRLEKQILETLRAYAKTNPAPKIVEAAQICGCSVSQVSKAVKKAGFGGYKAYIRYLYYGERPKTEALVEIERLKRILEEFDVALVDEFVELLRGHQKVVLFGYGPSAICAQYVEYKLRFCVDAVVAVPRDETSLRSMVDETTLLVILTTTGQYRSFHDVSLHAQQQGADVVVVSEEFNSVLMEDCTRYFVLAHHKQSDTLEPYQKTRTVFFIFFEQVVQRMMTERAPEPPATQS